MIVVLIPGTASITPDAVRSYVATLTTAPPFVTAAAVTAPVASSPASFWDAITEKRLIPAAAAWEISTSAEFSNVLPSMYTLPPATRVLLEKLSTFSP